MAHTSTFALTNTTIAYAAMLADIGAEAAARKDRALALGFNTYKGKITCLAVADAFSLECSEIEQVIGK